jgi:hypothetical protein
LRTDNLLAGKLILPLRGRLPAIVLSSAASLWKTFRAQAERGSGIGLQLFGFIAESAFTFIPESRSGSPRNTVRNHPGIAFGFVRIPHCCSMALENDSRIKPPMKTVRHGKPEPRKPSKQDE